MDDLFEQLGEMLNPKKNQEIIYEVMNEIGKITLDHQVKKREKSFKEK